MIRAVLFDLDGVLTTERTGSQSTLRSLAHHTGVPLEVLKAAYYPYNRDLLIGRITHRDMWAEFCKKVGREIDFRLLNVAFLETPLDCEMLKLVEELHSQCKTALVTDNKVDRVAAILGHHHLDDIFDSVSVSAKVGSGKDNPVIFQRVLDELELEAHECLFVDNTERNLIVPRMMGMATLLFDDAARDLTGLRRLLGV